MIYYGQELGEQARDNEGFAGDNDRTTIFDYWSLSTIRRWINGGKCDDELLSPHERWLRDVYRKVLTLCNDRVSLREGNFFDLMYANLRQEGFDPHRHFAFLRYEGDDVLLIVVNFSTEESHVNVMIPQLAFEMTGMKKGEILTKDLLWGKAHKLKLSTDSPVSVYLRSVDAVVLAVGRLEDFSGTKMTGSRLRGEKKS